ncbi:flavin reductase [Lachnospiraceae bacterium ZAX-1]
MNFNAFRHLSYGVYVISTLDKERPTGCTANSAMQITSDPATIAISMNHNNYTNACIQESGKFALSILSENTDASVIGNFGFQSGKDVNKFDAVPYETKQGLPIYKECKAYIVCEVIDKMETNTHTVFLGKVIDADEMADGVPMTYSYYHTVVKGKSPKNAPTYLPTDQEKGVASDEGKYVCSICKYTYEGDTPFEELPDDYVCPICKQPKSSFKKQ